MNARRFLAAVVLLALGAPSAASVAAQGVPPPTPTLEPAQAAPPRIDVLLTIPAFVQNFDPLAHLWSGPTVEAVDFGLAGPQFTTFRVFQQEGQRFFVFNPVTQNYGWIDVASVGASGPPTR